MGILDFLKPKRPLVNRGYLSSYDKETLTQKWALIEQLLSSGSPAAKRQAIIDADKALDYTLDRLFPNQEGTGARLKLAKEIFLNRRREYDEIWFAHKVRNEMVHNLNFEMPAVEVKSTLEKFKVGLQILGGLP